MPIKKRKNIVRLVPFQWHRHSMGLSRLESERTAVAKEFPTLTFVVSEKGSMTLTGDITVQIGNDHEIFRTAKITIIFSPDYPAIEPVAKIARGTFVAHPSKSLSDRHINDDGVCCLDIQSFWDSKDPAALVKWLRNVVVFVHRQFLYDMNGGNWPGPEWKHGIQGKAQFVEEKLGRLGLVPVFIATVEGVPINRRGACPCGSGKPYGPCHKRVVRDVLQAISNRQHRDVAVLLRGTIPGANALEQHLSTPLSPPSSYE